MPTPYTNVGGLQRSRREPAPKTAEEQVAELREEVHELTVKANDLRSELNEVRIDTRNRKAWLQKLDNKLAELDRRLTGHLHGDGSRRIVD